MPGPTRRAAGSPANWRCGIGNTTCCWRPVTPTAAPPVDTLYNSDAFPRWTKGAPYTLPFNLTGQPAASMPAGLTASGLPVGLQIVGPPRADALVLRALRACESAAGWTWPQPEVETWRWRRDPARRSRAVTRDAALHGALRRALAE